MFARLNKSFRARLTDYLQVLDTLLHPFVILPAARPVIVRSSPYLFVTILVRRLQLSGISRYSI